MTWLHDFLANQATAQSAGNAEVYPPRRISTGPANAVRATSPAIPYRRDRVEAPSNRPAPREPTLRSRAQDVLRSAPGALTTARERQVYDTTPQDVVRGAQEFTGLPSLARGAGGLVGLATQAGSGFLGPQHALPAAGAVFETAMGLAPLAGVPGRAAPVAAPAEAARPIPRIAREIGPNGMPVAQAQPTRNSFRGGSADLREAAALSPRPPVGSISGMPAPEGRRIVYQGGPRPLQGDTLDDAQLGTGQGASTFGRGHYVAENPVVGESYARQLGEDGRGFTHELDIPEGPYIDIFKPFSQQDPRAQEAIRRLAPQFNWDAMTSEMSDTLTILGRNEQRVAEQLSAEGVRGLRYLDQRSRPGSGISHLADPTSNYVVFRGADARRRFPDFGQRTPPPTTPTGTAPFGDPRAYPPQAWEEFGSLQGGTPEARLRAQEQGWDAPGYHATTADIQGGMRPSLSGELGPGAYIARQPKTTETYIGGSIWNDFDATPPSRPQQFFEGANIMPIVTRGKIATREQLDAAQEAARVRMRRRYRDDQDVQQAAADDLRAQGYTGASDPTRDFTVMFADPDGQIRNVRSVNAAFDPAKRDSSDLLAGLSIAAPIPIAGALSQQQTNTGRSNRRPSLFSGQR